MEKHKMNSSQILVSVHMISYNQEQYIEDAIKGVLMQKTNFLIELIISDDRSTDSTTFIINKYAAEFPSVIKTIDREKNIGSMANFTDTFSYCKGTYIAICEGDDYWTDPYKLQKQVDFLEAHEEYGLVCTNFEEYYQDKRLFKTNKSLYNTDTDIEFSNLLFKNHIGTVTVLLRTSVLKQASWIFKYMLEKKWRMGDFPLWLSIASISKLRYLHFSSAVYRVLSNSASGRNDITKAKLFYEHNHQIQHFFIERHKVDEKLVMQIEHLYLKDLLNIATLLRDKKLAERTWHQMKELKLKLDWKQKFYYLSSKFFLTRTLLFLLKKYK